MGGGTTSGCSKEEKPECVSNLDCKGSETCVKGKCTAKSDEGGPCAEDGTGPSCLAQSADNKPLVCDRGVCKVRCQTHFDCDPGQRCDVSTGICGKPTPDGGGEAPPPDEGGGQQESETCGPGQSCAAGLDCVKRSQNQTNGQCWKPCKADKDCAAGRLCAGGHCVPSDAKCQQAGGQITQACWPGLECVLEGVAEGSCLRSCTGNDCPTGLACDTKNGKKFCLPLSDKAGEGQDCGDIGGKKVGCVEGTECVPERQGSSKNICTKKCNQDTDWKWPRFCQGSLCVLGNAGTASLGQACKTGLNAKLEERCDGGLFCLTLGQNSQEGFCYRDCGPRSDPCPPQTVCTSVGGRNSLCLKECKDNNDCPNAPATTCGQLQGTNKQVCLHPTP